MCRKSLILPWGREGGRERNLNKLILKKFKYQGGFPKREGRGGKGFWSFKFMMHDVIVLKDVSL